MTAVLTEPPTLSSLAAVPDLTLDVALLAHGPISHGAGNAGNTQLLRTEPHIWRGRRVEVPFVSGNSIRHRLRDALAWHLVLTLDVPEVSLARRVVDLLWSGGALTSTGNRADLGMMRRVARIILGVSAMGYSAKSDMAAGTLYARMAHLVCRENDNRMPPALLSHPHAALPMTVFRGRTFGTRHDVSGTPVARYITIEGPEDLLGLGLGDGKASKADKTDKARPQQMIYDIQVIIPGTVLYTGLDMQVPTIGHVAALAVAIDEAAPDRAGQRILTLGGKASGGFGRCALYADLDGAFGPYGGLAALRAQYEAHLRAHRDEILALLPELVG